MRRTQEQQQEGTVVLQNADRTELVRLLRAALAIADKLEEWRVGAELDHALIALTGSGTPPPIDALGVEVA